MENIFPDEAPQVAEEAVADELPTTVCDVRFRNNTKVYFFDPGALTITTDDAVILDTARGPEYGLCVRGNHPVTAREVVAPLRKVLRLATEADHRTHENNLQREKYAFNVCQRKIEDLKLDMQLVSTECAFDGSKILFFFTADERVDFRELVKALASALRTRIELRQIGVRDKAKMVGGLGICGRPFCCREFLDNFQPVSIKMAKTQSLSLNPTKISGTCGRLMCCLNYEQETYEDLLRSSPKVESFVDTPDGRGTVTSVNLLRQSVQVRLEKQPESVVCHKNCDICVLRSGKAKKTDEPIPDDLQPISGAKAREEAPKPMATYLEPVVLRQTNESLVGEAPHASEEEGAPTGRNHRRRSGKNRPKGEKPPFVPQQKQRRQEPEEGGEEAFVPMQKKKPHRNNNYYRRRKSGGKPKE